MGKQLLYLEMGHPFGTWPPVSWQLQRRRRYRGVVVAMQWMSSGPMVTLLGRRRSRWASRRWQHSFDRIRFSVVVQGGSDQRRSWSRDPHLSFICAVRQEPINRIRVGRPRSGRRDKGPYWWRSTNILPLDLNPSFNFISFTFVHSSID